MNRGYTKSWRKKYASQSASRGLLYIGAMDWLVGNANWSESFVNGVKIERGQLFVGRKKLSQIWKESEQTIRTILKNLEKDGFLTSKATNKGNLITICNYDIYQPDETTNQPAVQPVANQQLTSNQPHLKNINNINNNNNYIAHTCVKNNLNPEWLGNEDFCNAFELFCQSASESMGEYKKKFTTTNAAAAALECTRKRDVEKAITSLLYSAQSKSWNLLDAPPEFPSKQQYKNNRVIPFRAEQDLQEVERQLREDLAMEDEVNAIKG